MASAIHQVTGGAFQPVSSNKSSRKTRSTTSLVTNICGRRVGVTQRRARPCLPFAPPSSSRAPEHSWRVFTAPPGVASPPSSGALPPPPSAPQWVAETSLPSPPSPRSRSPWRTPPPRASPRPPPSPAQPTPRARRGATGATGRRVRSSRARGGRRAGARTSRRLRASVSPAGAKSFRWTSSTPTPSPPPWRAFRCHLRH